jgi:DNA repair exonuclease SbcCD ATPase subunit
MVSDLSGYETFILNIALKLSLVKCSSRGRGSVMFIDEGLDCIDSNNRTKLKEFFQMLKKEFNHIFLISHIPDFHQYQDHSIYISRFGENCRYSKAEFR